MEFNSNFLSSTMINFQVKLYDMKNNFGPRFSITTTDLKMSLPNVGKIQYSKK